MNVFKSLAEALLSGKPYFGPALRAMQGVPERHQYFSGPVVLCVARQPSERGLEVLEIGSWAGASTLTWALALLQAEAAGSVTCVDPWEPYFDVTKDSGETYIDMNAAARDGLIVRLFEHNIRAAGVDTIVRVHRGSSRNILPDLPGDSFDIIYIDGSHEFDDVCFDIDQAKRLLRGDGVICGDDLELEAAALPKDELREAIKENLDFDYSEAAKAHYHPGVTGAVAKEFGTVGVWDGFWGVQRRGSEWIPPVLDLTTLSLPDHIRSAAEQRDPSGRSDMQENPTSGASPVPILTGNYRGYNLVAYKGGTFAFHNSVGLVDATEGEAELERRFGQENVLFADTMDGAKARIDSMEFSRELARHAAATAESLRSQQAQMDTIDAALKDMGTAADAVLRQSRVDSQETAQELARHAAATAENLRSQQAQIDTIDAALKDMGTTADAVLRQFRIDSHQTAQELAGHAAATIENLRTHQSRIETLDAALKELGTATDALSRQYQLVTAQLGLLQFGPGDPETPCLSGQHRDFELVRYRGRVYALRRPLEPGVVQLGEQELFERHGSGDVLAGESLDGVRARIDVLEGLKDVQAQVLSLDQDISNHESHLAGKLREVLSEISSMRDELVASSSRLAGDLQQTDATLQSHARNLERLARSWPNRLLGILPR